MHPAIVSVVLPFNASLNSSCAHPPPPPPRATAEHLSSCLVSPGGRALANFVLPWGLGICLEPRSNRLCNHDDQMMFMMMPRL